MEEYAIKRHTCQDATCMPGRDMNPNMENPRPCSHSAHQALRASRRDEVVHGSSALALLCIAYKNSSGFSIQILLATRRQNSAHSTPIAPGRQSVGGGFCDGDLWNLEFTSIELELCVSNERHHLPQPPSSPILFDYCFWASRSGICAT